MGLDAARLFLAVILWSAVIAGLVRYRRLSPVHPFFLALVTTGLVGSFYPVLSTWIATTSWRHGADADVELVRAVQLDYAVYAWALLAGFAVSRGRRRVDAVDRRAPSRAYLRHRDAWVAFGLAACGLALYALYVRSVGVASLTDRDNFALKWQRSEGLGPLVLGLHLAIVGCFWAEGSTALGPRAKRVYRLLALAIAAWSLGVIAQRTNAVVLALGYATIHCARRGVQLRRVRPALVVGVLALYAGVEVFSVVRSTWRDGIGRSLDAVAALGDTQGHALGTLVGGSELSHPVFTALELRQLEDAGALAGASYLAAPATLVPRAIAPGRPETLALGFVAENYPAMAARGGGAAFSFVGEAWWNFGAVFGPLLIGLAVGALLARLDAANATRPTGALAMLTPYLATHVAMLHRYESATLLKQTLSVALPALCVLGAAHLMWTGTGRATRPSRAALPGRPARPRGAVAREGGAA